MTIEELESKKEEYEMKLHDITELISTRKKQSMNRDENLFITSKIKKEKCIFVLTNNDTKEVTRSLTAPDMSTLGDNISVKLCWETGDDIKSNINIPISYDNVNNVYCITEENVRDFISSVEVKTLDGRTTLVTAVLKNGFTIYETSTSVSEKNYNEQIGVKLCMKKIYDKVFELLGFTLKCIQN